jgi:hypothetical protein
MRISKSDGVTLLCAATKHIVRADSGESSVFCALHKKSEIQQLIVSVRYFMGKTGKPDPVRRSPVRLRKGAAH